MIFESPQIYLQQGDSRYRETMRHALDKGYVSKMTKDGVVKTSKKKSPTWSLKRQISDPSGNGSRR